MVVFYVGFDVVFARLSCFTKGLIILLAPHSQVVLFCVGFDGVFANLSCFPWVLTSFWSQVPRWSCLRCVCVCAFDAVLANLSCFTWVLGLSWFPSFQVVVFHIDFVVILPARRVLRGC